MNHSQLVHDIQLGHIRAKIWNDSNSLQGKFEVTLHRVEKNGERTISTDRFEIDDLPVLSEVLDMAHLWICEQTLVIA
jgi:hypothetical protein